MEQYFTGLLLTSNQPFGAAIPRKIASFRSITPVFLHIAKAQIFRHSFCHEQALRAHCYRKCCAHQVFFGEVWVVICFWTLRFIILYKRRFYFFSCCGI
jgi:hypothetical protein